MRLVVRLPVCRSLGQLERCDMTARDEMLSLIQSRKPGHSLPQPFYIDPQFFNLDMELIWYRDWLFIGHDCELPKAGSYFTLQIGDYPVVVVRDREGQIRAFHNSCRHRGSRVCNQPKGTVRQAGLPLSPMDLQAGRQARLRPPDGRWFRSHQPFAEARRLRKRRPAISSSASPTSRPISSRSAT